MRAPVDDLDLEAILGHVHGVRGPTLEEAAAMQADFLRDRAADLLAGRYYTVDARELWHAARLLDTLALLSREATPDL